uniref:Uncharacterized protein n=1 Tax=Physcomitrium patens TaxID=3218 RepID=A0A2K1KTX8_PHYPA|nr:hypothetical protein PHYPA_004222 [Physcomitrium patens]
MFYPCAIMNLKYISSTSMPFGYPGFVQVFRWPHYVCIFKTLARFPVQTQARIQGFSEHDGRQHDNLRVEPHVIVVEIGLKSQRRHQSRSWALDMSCA